MSDISILYVPAKGDPHGVLADGLCGARCPWVYHDGDWFEGSPYLDVAGTGGDRLALPLVWRGEVVHEGRHRLGDRLEGGAWAPVADVSAAPAHLETRELRFLWALATVAVRELGGSVEVLGV